MLSLPKNKLVTQTPTGRTSAPADKPKQEEQTNSVEKVEKILSVECRNNPRSQALMFWHIPFISVKPLLDYVEHPENINFDDLDEIKSHGYYTYLVSKRSIISIDTILDNLEDHRNLLISPNVLVIHINDQVYFSYETFIETNIGTLRGYIEFQAKVKDEEDVREQISLLWAKNPMATVSNRQLHGHLALNLEQALRDYCDTLCGETPGRALRRLNDTITCAKRVEDGLKGWLLNLDDNPIQGIGFVQFSVEEPTPPHPIIQYLNNLNSEPNVLAFNFIGDRVGSDIRGDAVAIRSYKNGDIISLKITDSPVTGYVYILNYGTDDHLTMIYPERSHEENKEHTIQRNEDFRQDFQFNTNFSGSGIFKALVTTHELPHHILNKNVDAERKGKFRLHVPLGSAENCLDEFLTYVDSLSPESWVCSSKTLEYHIG